MPWFKLDVEGTVHEVYRVEANSAAEARAKFERGEVGPPDVMETISTDTCDVSEEKV